MTDLTFSMPDGREEKTNKQTKFSWIILEEVTCRWFSRAISYVLDEHHGLVLKYQTQWKIMMDVTSP